MKNNMSYLRNCNITEGFVAWGFVHLQTCPNALVYPSLGSKQRSSLQHFRNIYMLFLLIKTWGDVLELLMYVTGIVHEFTAGEVLAVFKDLL